MRTDVSGWKTRLSDELIAENTASGIWRNKTLADQLDAVLAQNPDKVMVIEGARRLTAAQLDRQARALASALQGRGLVAGDVVSFELPNWPETMVIDLACAMLGLVCNPIIPIYRDAEVSYILRDAGTRAIFVPTEFRNFDYADMIARHRAELPDLDLVVTVRGDAEGATGFDALLAEGDADAFAPTTVDPNAVKLIMYTSGTTGRPKGVLHSHNTIDTEIQAISNFLGLGEDDVVLFGIEENVLDPLQTAHVLDSVGKIGCLVFNSVSESLFQLTQGDLSECDGFVQFIRNLLHRLEFRIAASFDAHNHRLRKNSVGVDFDTTNAAAGVKIVLGHRGDRAHQCKCNSAESESEVSYVHHGHGMDSCLNRQILQVNSAHVAPSENILYHG